MAPGTPIATIFRCSATRVARCSIESVGPAGCICTAAACWTRRWWWPSANSDARHASSAHDHTLAPAAGITGRRATRACLPAAAFAADRLTAPPTATAVLTRNTCRSIRTISFRPSITPSASPATLSTSITCTGLGGSSSTADRFWDSFSAVPIGKLPESPESSHTVVVENRIGRCERETFRHSRGCNQAIKRIAMMQRHCRQGINVICLKG